MNTCFFWPFDASAIAEANNATSRIPKTLGADCKDRKYNCRILLHLGYIAIPQVAKEHIPMNELQMPEQSGQIVLNSRVEDWPLETQQVGTNNKWIIVRVETNMQERKIRILKLLVAKEEDTKATEEEEKPMKTKAKNGETKKDPNPEKVRKGFGIRGGKVRKGRKV